jgi:serine/threonine protein kinase
MDMSAQIVGLAGALDTIHNPPDAPHGPYGRHGDIKPENILWFLSEEHPRGFFVITDFGLSSINSEFSRSNIRNRDIAFSPRYRPPENDMDGGLVSRSYDIWTLGCLYLEMACWMLGGIKEIEQFELARMSPSSTGFTVSTFFDIRLSEGSKSEGNNVDVFMVK